MNTQHSKGETIEAKDDYASLVALFLCQARNPDEAAFNLNLLNLDLADFNSEFISAIRERILCEPGMLLAVKDAALNLIDGHLALRELKLELEVA